MGILTRLFKPGVACLIAVLGIGANALEQPAAETPSFDIWEIQVEGNTLVDSRQIERAVYPHLGPDKTIDDVEQAREALESIFRTQGFGTVLVNIPEQDVNEGIVRLSVIEGRIERLHVTGSRYFSLGRIKAKVPSLSAGQSPELPRVQEELSALNKATPDRVVTPVLRPGRTPGMVDVELKVDDKLPVHGSVELNDQYTRDTSRTRLSASLRYDNLWQKEHSLGLSYQVSPQDPNEVQVFSGTYLLRPENSDLLFVLYGLRSNSDVLTGTSAAGVGVLGKGWVGGVRVVKPLPNVAEFNHNVTLGLDYKDFEDTVNPVGGAGFTTPLSYTKLVAGYSGFRLTDSATWRYNLEMNFGVRGLGNTEKEFESKRFQGKPNFLFLRHDISVEQALPLGSQLYAQLAGQIASGALVSNEQFSLGGDCSVRGYLDTQVLVDDAIRSRIEFRSPSFAAVLPLEIIDVARVVMFGDIAYGRIQEPLPGQGSTTMLSSVGLGFRFEASPGLNSKIDWAYPLSNNGEIRSGESRLHFSFAQQF